MAVERTNENGKNGLDPKVVNAMLCYGFQLFILLLTVFGIHYYVESRQTLLLRRALCIF